MHNLDFSTEQVVIDPGDIGARRVNSRGAIHIAYRSGGSAVPAKPDFRPAWRAAMSLWRCR
jgi:hypothetical protein